MELPEVDDFLKSFFNQLRTDEVSPLPGFYGRVVERIDCEQRSRWHPLISSGVQLVALTFVLCAACFICLIITEAAMRSAVYSDRRNAASRFSSADIKERRDAVLAELAMYSKNR